jgi:3-keto-disaccharide hydrolase
MYSNPLGPIATHLTRRRLLITAAAAGASMSIGSPIARSQASASSFDFSKPLDGWTIVSGKWAIEEVPGDWPGDPALVQLAQGNQLNVIVAPGGPYGNVEVSVRFRLIFGSTDVSAGIVFRFAEDRYYVIRADTLEDNFNLSYYDRGLRQIAGANVQAPAMEQWHKLRISAVGDRIQGWLNDQALIDERDSRFASGRIGLWTRADSMTAFNDLTVTQLNE